MNLCCGAPGGQLVSFLMAAALLFVLLLGPQPVVSDSDELVHSEWEVWKNQHGVNYDENVRHLRPTTATFVLKGETKTDVTGSLWCVVFYRMMHKGGSSGRRTSG